VPVPAAEQGDGCRHEEGADDGGVKEDPGAESGGQDLLAGDSGAGDLFGSPARPAARACSSSAMAPARSISSAPDQGLGASRLTWRSGLGDLDDGESGGCHCG
jgi:hypothetical protein